MKMNQLSLWSLGRRKIQIIVKVKVYVKAKAHAESLTIENRPNNHYEVIIMASHNDNKSGALE